MKSYSVFIALLILLSPVVYGNNFKLIDDAVAQASEVTEQQVAELYVATFNRAPDKPGLDFWVYDSGFTIEQIAESFFDQTETQDLYLPGTTEAMFVTSVYDNLFNRLPDAAGQDYWIYALESGAVTRPVMIEAVKNGAQGTDAEIVANKTEVGLYYANKNLQEYFSLSNVTEDISTVDVAKSNIDSGDSGNSGDDTSGNNPAGIPDNCTWDYSATIDGSPIDLSDYVPPTIGPLSAQELYDIMVSAVEDVEEPFEDNPFCTFTWDVQEFNGSTVIVTYQIQCSSGSYNNTIVGVLTWTKVSCN